MCTYIYFWNYPCAQKLHFISFWIGLHFNLINWYNHLEVFGKIGVLKFSGRWEVFWKIGVHKLIACQTDFSNMKSGKLQKLGGSRKIFIFRGVIVLWGGDQKIFIFRGVDLLGGDNFLGGDWYPSAHYALHISHLLLENVK